MSAPVRVAIIGTGSIADDCHAPAVTNAPGATLVSVLSRDRDKGAEFLERHGAGRGVVHTSVESLAGDRGIDCVIIASPDRLHAGQAIACMEAGKDVLLEKPMAISLAEALELERCADRNRRVFAVGFHLKWHHGHRALYDQVVGANAIGALRHVRAIWAFPQPDPTNWRAQQALGKWWSLAAVGAHCIDLARWYAGDRDDWAQFHSVISNDLWQSPHDETAVIAAKFRSGPTIEVVSSIQFGPLTRLELFGSDGHAVCEGTFGRKGAGEIMLNGADLPFEAQSPFLPQLTHFLECVRNRQAPLSGSVVGVRNVKDLLAASDV